MKISFFLFFILILEIYSQDLTVNTFISTFGEYNDKNNWYLGRVPDSGDLAFIQPSYTAYSKEGKIYGGNIRVGLEGYDNTQTLLFTEYGIQSDLLWLDFESTFYVNKIPLLKATDTQYFMDITEIISQGYTWINQSHFFAPNTLITNVYAVDRMYDSIYEIGGLVSSAAVTLAYDSEVYIPVLYLEAGAGFFGYDSSVYFTDPTSSLVLNTTSVLNVYDSTFTCFSNFLITGVDSSLYFENTVVRILNNSTSFQLVDGLLTINKCGDFISNKPFYTKGSNQTLFGILGSNVVFTEKSEFEGDASFLVYDSVFQTHKGFTFEGGSLGYFNNSLMEIYGDFIGKNNTYFEFVYSNVTISNKLYSSESRILGLQDNCWLMFRNSDVKLDSNLVTVGESYLIALETNIEIKDNALFSGLSVVQMNYTVFSVNSIFSMRNASTFVSFYSTISVEGSTTFFDLSKYSFNYVDFYVNGFFIDDTDATEIIMNSFHYSNLTIKGFYGNNGGFYFNNSLLVCNGEFNNIGKFESINSTILVDKTFTNQAYTSMINTTLKIISGSMVMKLDSNMTMTDSTIEILDGQVILESKQSLLNLVNTTLINRNGSLKVNGNIVVNENGTLTNNAKFTLNSNVILRDSNGGGSEEFINNGQLDIENDDSADTGSSSTSILIKFKNQGGSVNIGKETVMLNLDQNNANLTMKYSNTSLLIQNDLNSAYDSITFTVGSDSLSSSINVSNNANIQNSTLVIRVPNNLSNEQKNSTLLSYSSLSGSGFKSYGFKQYDPETGTEKDLDTCKHKVEVSGTSVSVLLNSQNECGGGSLKSLGTGGIVGIVVGVAGAAVIVGVIIHFRNRLPKSQQLKYKLKQLSKDSQSTSTTTA